MIVLLEAHVFEVFSPAALQLDIRGVGDDLDLVEEYPQAQLLRDACQRCPRAGEPGRDVDQGDEEPLREHGGVAVGEPGGQAAEYPGLVYVEGFAVRGGAEVVDVLEEVVDHDLRGVDQTAGQSRCSAQRRLALLQRQ